MLQRAAEDPRLRLHGHWDRQFDPRNVQPVASRYTDWAIAAHSGVLLCVLFVVNLMTLPLLSNNERQRMLYWKGCRTKGRTLKDYCSMFEGPKKTIHTKGPQI
jgi:hypothetical protein